MRLPEAQALGARNSKTFSRGVYHGPLRYGEAEIRGRHGRSAAFAQDVDQRPRRPRAGVLCGHVAKRYAAARNFPRSTVFTNRAASPFVAISRPIAA